MDKQILSKLLDKSNITELSNTFSNYDLPSTKIAICKYLAEQVNEDEISSFINENSGNWHQYIYLFPLVREIDSTTYLNQVRNIQETENIKKFGEFQCGDVSGFNFLVYNTAKIIIGENGNAIIREVKFAHIVKTWIYRGNVVLNVSTFESDTSKWIEGTVYKVIEKSSYDSICANVLSLLNSNTIIIRDELIHYQSIAKELFLNNRYKINRSKITNTDGGQTDLSLPDNKFYFSEAINLGFTAQSLNTAFSDNSRTHNIIYSYWDFDDNEYRVNLHPNSGMITISKSLSFNYKIDIIKLIIDSL